jgi:hypothetical protein
VPTSVSSPSVPTILLMLAALTMGLYHPGRDYERQAAKRLDEIKQL